MTLMKGIGLELSNEILEYRVKIKKLAGREILEDESRRMFAAVY
jgi:hypothetical protein